MKRIIGYLALTVAILISLQSIAQAQDLRRPSEIPAVRMDWNPNNNLIAISDGGNIVTIFDAQNRAVINALPLISFPVRALRWSDDGTRLAIGGEYTIQVWNNARDGEQMVLALTIQVPADPLGLDMLSVIDWNDSAQQILTTVLRQVYIWNTQTGQLIRTIEPVSTPLVSASWSPDGTMLAYASSTGFVSIASLTTDEVSGAETYDRDAPWAMSWEANGDNLVVGTNSGTLQAFDFSPRRLGSDVVSLRADYVDIFSVDWHPTLPLVAVGYADGIVEIWNPDTYNLVQRVQEETGMPVMSVSWSPDGMQLAYADGNNLIIVPAPTAELPTLTFTPIHTDTPTFTATPMPSPTPTATFTFTPTFPSTPTETPTLTPTYTSTLTFTPTFTPTATFTSTSMATFTPTPSVTCTATIAASDALGLVNAITAANANGASLDIICLTANSTYTFLSASNSIALPSITTPITIVGNGAILERGNGAPQFRLFNVTASGSLTLQNLTVRNFHAGGGNGGAILNAGSVTLDGVTVTGNSARFAGGIHSSGTLTITNSTLSSNTSQEDAGAIYLNSGSLTMSDTTIQSNSARYGSGIYANDGTVSLTNVIFRTNTANEQGAALFQRRGTVTISGGMFDANTARFGSAIYVRGALGVTGTTFTNNVAVEEGAAIYNENGNQSTVTVSVSTFTGNRARYGGAIYNRARLNVATSVFSTNTATESGGAVYHQNGNSQNSIAQSCFSGNTARFGGAAFSQTGNFNAQNNWWGAASGPTSALVNNQVQTSPFLTAGCPN